MARLSYSFKDRYLLTGTVRRDGFSGFGPNKKFASFPSVSVGWVASDEAFFKDLKGVYLKLRASYGKNGNQGIGSYSSFSRMGTDAYVYGSSTAKGGGTRHACDVCSARPLRRTHASDSRPLALVSLPQL